MSHPNPTHDKDNEYPSDNYKPVGAHAKALDKKKKSKKVPHNKGKTQYTTYTGSGPMKGKKFKTSTYF